MMREQSITFGTVTMTTPPKIVHTDTLATLTAGLFSIVEKQKFYLPHKKRYLIFPI